MYIERIKSKNNYYLYLRKYDASYRYSTDKRVLLFGFGREENALNNMEIWLDDIHLLPLELQDLGCTKDDVRNWIDSVRKKRNGYILTC